MFLLMAYRQALVHGPNQYDLCHVHGLYNEAVPALRAYAPSVPIIATVHSYHMAYSVLGEHGQRYEERPIRSIIRDQSAILRSVDLLAHVSRADREKGLRLGVEWACPDVILHNGISFSQNDVPPSLSRSRSIVFVGAMVARKRPFFVLEAFRRLGSDEQVTLHFAGSGPLFSRMADAAAGVKRVQVHGRLGHDELRQLMRGQAALVVPSLSESFGLVYLEALSEGLCVIGFDRVIEEFHGLLECSDSEKALLRPFAADQTDPARLAADLDVMLGLYFSREGERTMNGLRQKAVDFFSWPHTVRRVKAMYEVVAGGDAGLLSGDSAPVGSHRG
jgi:glycosyltransferase involved in cell wall biosynthesis